MCEYNMYKNYSCERKFSSNYIRKFSLLPSEPLVTFISLHLYVIKHKT